MKELLGKSKKRYIRYTFTLFRHPKILPVIVEVEIHMYDSYYDWQGYLLMTAVTGDVDVHVWPKTALSLSNSCKLKVSQQIAKILEKWQNGPDTRLLIDYS